MVMVCDSRLRVVKQFITFGRPYMGRQNAKAAPIIRRFSPAGATGTPPAFRSSDETLCWEAGNGRLARIFDDQFVNGATHGDTFFR